MFEIKEKTEVTEVKSSENSTFDLSVGEADKFVNALTDKFDSSENNEKFEANETYFKDGELFTTDENGEKDFCYDLNEVCYRKDGGCYKELYVEGEGDIYEINHIPPDSVTEIPRNDGPAIRMDKADHRQTASCGNSLEAREYRAEQKKLIDEGDFRKAIQMDIDDIRDKFDDKYDKALVQMLIYVSKLENVRIG